MLCIHGQHLRLKCPILVQLRRKFDEIAGNACPAYILVGTLGKKAVQSMSELMEHRRCLVECKKRRLTGCRLREIGDIGYDRTDILPVFRNLLITEIRHPGPSPLRTSLIIVSHQYAEKRAVRICHLKDFDIRMINRHAVEFFEIHAIKPVRRLENPVPDILHTEIRFDSILVYREPGQPDPLRIIRPVPRPYHGRTVVRKYTGGNIGIHDGLHIRHLFSGPGHT